MTALEANNKHKTNISQYTDQLLSDGKSVIYSAPFTAMNDKFLYKPRNEMLSFCEAQNGTLFIQKKFNKYLDGLYQNPTAAYFDALNANITRVAVIDRHGLPAEIKIVNRDAQLIATLSEMHTVQRNSSALAQSYAAAINENSFGVFVCRDNRTNKRKWGVSIDPIAFSAEDPNNKLITNFVYLLITPIK